MRSLVPLLFLAPMTAIRIASAQPAPSGKPLGDNGVLIGANTEPGSAEKEGISGWKDADKVKAVLARDFGLVQTTAYPAWGAWTGSGMNDVGFDIAGANEVINWAKGHDKKTAFHLLAGSPTYFPAWLNGGTWRAGQLDSLLDRWITFAMTANGNDQKVDYWNVVNEAFMWNGNYWDSSSAANTNPWHKMGWEADQSGLTGAASVYARHPVYIRRAFEIARRHTRAKLEIRDYSIEFWDDSRKSRAFYQLVKHLLNSGVPVDAVGLQCHFRTDQTYDWAKLKRAVQEYRNLGLEVYITETDYGDTDPVAAAGSAHRTAAWDTLQAKQYRALVTAAVGGGAKWICLWGVADNTNDYWRKGQSALLFDESYAAKYAYYEFRQGILDGLAPTALGRSAPKPGMEGIRIRDTGPQNRRYLQLDGRLLSGPFRLRRPAASPVIGLE
jgi:endo-1,4-beta-xylanase